MLNVLTVSLVLDELLDGDQAEPPDLHEPAHLFRRLARRLRDDLHLHILHVRKGFDRQVLGGLPPGDQQHDRDAEKEQREDRAEDPERDLMFGAGHRSEQQRRDHQHAGRDRAREVGAERPVAEGEPDRDRRQHGHQAGGYQLAQRVPGADVHDPAVLGLLGAGHDPRVVAELSAHLREEIDRWVAKFPPDRKRSAVISALHAAQHENGGHLTTPLMDAIAAFCCSGGTSPASMPSTVR